VHCSGRTEKMANGPLGCVNRRRASRTSSAVIAALVNSCRRQPSDDMPCVRAKHVSPQPWCHAIMT